MSTVRLKKPRGEHKAGAIISVPFCAARDLIRDGVAELAQESQPVATPRPAVPTLADRHAAEIARLNAVHADTVRTLKEEAAEAAKKREAEHAAALANARAELEAAQKTIADLNAKAAATPKK